MLQWCPCVIYRSIHGYLQGRSHSSTSGTQTGAVLMLHQTYKGLVMTGYWDYLLLEVTTHSQIKLLKNTTDRNVLLIVLHELQQHVFQTYKNFTILNCSFVHRSRDSDILTGIAAIT